MTGISGDRPGFTRPAPSTTRRDSGSGLSPLPKDHRLATPQWVALRVSPLPCGQGLGVRVDEPSGDAVHAANNVVITFTDPHPLPLSTRATGFTYLGGVLPGLPSPLWRGAGGEGRDVLPSCGLRSQGHLARSSRPSPLTPLHKGEGRWPASRLSRSVNTVATRERGGVRRRGSSGSVDPDTPPMEWVPAQQGGRGVPGSTLRDRSPAPPTGLV